MKTRLKKLKPNPKELRNIEPKESIVRKKSVNGLKARLKESRPKGIEFRK